VVVSTFDEGNAAMTSVVADKRRNARGRNDFISEEFLADAFGTLWLR
jgi:hypothetical protein